MSVAQDIQMHLPKSIRDMIVLIGLDATLIVVRECGGQRPFIPRQASSEHPLALSLGMEVFTALCANYPSAMLNIPRCLKALNLLRDATMLTDRRGGMTLNDCARKYNLTERGVSKAMRRIEKEELKPWYIKAKGSDQQGDLFEFLARE